MYGKDKATLALVWARVGQPYPTRYPHGVSLGDSGLTLPDPIPAYRNIIYA